MDATDSTCFRTKASQKDIRVCLANMVFCPQFFCLFILTYISKPSCVFLDILFWHSDHLFSKPYVFFWTFYSGILTLYILIFHLRFRCNSFDFIFVLRSNNSKHSTLHNSEDFVCLQSFSISGIPTLRRYYEIRISS